MPPENKVLLIRLVRLNIIYLRGVMMKIKVLTILAIFSSFFWLATLQARPLPDTNSLKELKLDLALDLSERTDVALPSLGKITKKDEFVFFDARPRRLMVMSLDGRQVRTIGSFGDGPGEYQQVRDLLVDDDGLWILDACSRLMQYDFEGGLRQLWKLPFTALKLLGRSGQVFFLVCRTVSEEGQFENEVIRWQEGKEPVSLFKMPLVVMRTKAFSLEGKEIAGGGLITLSAPAFAFLGDRLAAAAGSSYSIRFFDLEGRETDTWKFEAPEPEYANATFNSFKKEFRAYAIGDMFRLPDRLAVIGNYFKKGKPRLDCFGFYGQLRSSWLIPLSLDPRTCRFWLDDRYLVYFSEEEGCRIYRVKSRL